MSTDGQGTKWRRKNAENFKWLSTARALQTDDRRKDDSIANVNVSSLKTLLDVGLVNYYYLYFTCRPLCILVSLCVSACDYSLSNSKCIAKDVTYCVYDTIRHDTIRWSILTMSRRPKLTRVGRGLYLRTKCHLDASSRLATINMGRKFGGSSTPCFGEGLVSPSSTMWTGPRPTSMPSAMLIHPAVRPQWPWAENWGLCPRSPPPFWEGGWVPI